MVKLKEAYDITTYDNEILEKKRGKKWEKRLIFFLTAKSWYLKNINTFSPKEIKEEDFHLLFQVSIDSELHVIVLPSVNVNEAILPEEEEEAGPTHRRLRNNAQCWNSRLFLPLTPDPLQKFTLHSSELQCRMVKMVFVDFVFTLNSASQEIS